jgi:hypothetical protein
MSGCGADRGSAGSARQSASMMTGFVAVPIMFLLFRWPDIYMDFLCSHVYVKVRTSIR